jgi:hypothetical protein
MLISTGGAVMRKSSTWSLRVCLVLLPGLSALGLPSHAQNPPLAFDQIVGQPRGLPELPPQGAWGEVINATPRWLVIQNHSGQQYPVSVDSVGEFLIRWPYSVAALTGQSVVEAVGRDLGSNVVETNHIDVFEGPDRSLVVPTYQSLIGNNMVVTTVDPGFNRFMNAWDYGGQRMLYGWAYPVSPGLQGIPARLHVVGNVADKDPLRLLIPGNNFAAVVAGANVEYTVSQVTRGSPAYVRKGDYAFMMPQEITPKGLVLSQLVVYKTIAFRQFDPNR